MTQVHVNLTLFDQRACPSFIIKMSPFLVLGASGKCFQFLIEISVSKLLELFYECQIIQLLLSEEAAIICQKMTSTNILSCVLCLQFKSQCLYVTINLLQSTAVKIQ